MPRMSRRIGKITLGFGVLLASATFCLVGLVGGRQHLTVAGTPKPASGAGGPITSIDLKSSITPNPVKVGQDLKVSGSVTIVGGPMPVKFTLTVPKPGGGSYTGSMTVTVDENGFYGFELPPLPADLDPNTYSFTMKAEAGAVSDTETVTLIVQAP